MGLHHSKLSQHISYKERESLFFFPFLQDHFCKAYDIFVHLMHETKKLECKREFKAPALKYIEKKHNAQKNIMHKKHNELAEINILEK